MASPAKTMKLLLRLFLLASSRCRWAHDRGVDVLPGRAAHRAQGGYLRGRHRPGEAHPGEARSAQGESGTLRTVTLSQHDVDLVLNYAASQLRRGSTRVALGPGTAMVQASLEIPGNPLGAWLNVDAALRETAGLPAFDHLRIGSLPVPGFVADYALDSAFAHLNATAEGRLAHDVVKSVSLSEAQVQIVYEWRDDIPDRLRAVLLSPADEARFKAHSDRLADVVDGRGAGRAVSLAQLLPPMFALARERSAGGDAVKENRAAIVALTFYANGRGLAAVIPAAKHGAGRRSGPSRSTGAMISPGTFLISAAIAVAAGTPLADAIGLYKEVEDSRGGSGFSFNDIARIAPARASASSP
jgi:hypothetical protein